ncbi:PAS domain S-box protein [Methylicorpusculum oleiharenae]|uniref:PAS domain S-box protein n=1 Tax=Methylicorpusculum oleiharenae TaxID=1338687 RepID=UPI001E36C81E|nr:PAS domain S-box protein [Methylicorpusculum oleiharenae]MCD2452486.1 PAS domain S-box protein [Methylicorpusculum oleiharenae]
MQALFAVIPNALLLTDKLGVIVEANPAAQNMFGYSADAMTGLRIESLIPDYYLTHRIWQQHQNPQDKRLADQGRLLFAQRSDGSQFQIDIRSSDLQTPNKVFILITLYDISTHWPQTQRISENAESQRAMIDQAIVGFVRTDLIGNITLANNCFSTITHLDQHALLGMNMLTLTHPDDRPRHFELFQRLVKFDHSFTFETRYQQNKEEPAWVTLSVSRICDALRRPSGTVAVVMDISARTLTSHALKCSEERLELAKRAAKLGIFDIDLIQNKIQCDRFIYDIWGFTSDEPLSYEKLTASIHPEDKTSRDWVFAETLKNGTHEYEIEYRVINQQKHHETWISVNSHIFYEGQQASRIVGVVQDISKRKLSEQKSQRNRTALGTLLKQQVANQTASAIAHELNQPLTAISAYSEVALKTLQSKTINADQLNKALQGCIEQAHRVGHTLHELLNVLNTNTINLELIDINTLIIDTLTHIQADDFDGVHAELQLEAGLPPVIGYRIQIAMVLINLIRNSIEAIRDANSAPGAISLTVRSIAEKNCVQITLQDNGPGLKEDMVKSIFEPFFTTKTGGIGMGLTISRALIESNGGHLWFDLKNDPGAIFHFTLPFAV